MPDLTIANAATLTGAGTASGDLFPLLDISASAGSQGSKITRDELRIGMGITGGGTLATGGFTLTLPATGTAALLGTANVFTAAQTINAGTLTTAALTLSQTWNNAGVTCRGLEYAVTNTNSASDSTLFRLLGGAAGATAKLAITQDARVCAEVGGAFPQFTGLGHTGTGMRIAADRVDFWLSSGVLMTVQSGSILLTGGQSIIFGTGGSTFTHSSNVMSLINTTTAQKFRVFKTSSGSQYIELDATGTNLINTTYALGNGAATSAGTITNAPAVGNPTKWIPINDNGTTRYIPAW
jgi:hypothetical protein